MHHLVSGCEGLIVYMGNDIFGIKWHNWRINFEEMESVFSEKTDWGMPRVYNRLSVPLERENVLFPDILGPVMIPNCFRSGSSIKSLGTNGSSPKRSRTG